MKKRSTSDDHSIVAMGTEHPREGRAFVAGAILKFTDMTDIDALKVVDQHGHSMPLTEYGLLGKWLATPTAYVGFKNLHAPKSPLTADSSAVRQGVEVLIAAANNRGWSEEQFESLLLQSALIIESRRPRGGALSDDQARFLVESGAMTEERLAELEGRVAYGELAEWEDMSRVSVVADSLSTDDVATLLEIQPSSVRHRQLKKHLYSFKVGAKRMYPLWQFTDGEKNGVLPNLAAVIDAIPEGMHAATVQGFMTTPQRSLLIQDERVTPVEWLKQGGDKQAVVDLLNGALQS